MILALLASLALAAPLTAAGPAGTAAVQEAQEARGEGQKLYDQGDYQSAADWYLQALQNEPRNAQLHYNLGNALFKAGKTGRAIAAYQRAFDMMPRDQDVRQNLDFALRRAGEELVPAAAPPLLFLAFHIFSERELAGLQWLACWLVLILAGLCLWQEHLRQRLMRRTWVAACLWLALGAWWLAVRGLTPQRRGVIVASAAEIRSGPGENFNVSFTAPEGRRVQILSRDGDWLEIGVLKESAKGWIATKNVEEI